MDISISNLAIFGSVSVVLLALKRAQQMHLTLSSWRSTVFYKTKLSDLEAAMTHVSADKKEAFRKLIESRIFKFLFGFCPDYLTQGAIYGALAAGHLSEGEVKLLGARLSFDGSKLSVRYNGYDTAFALIFVGIFIVAVLTPVYFSPSITPEMVPTVKLRAMLLGLFLVLWGIGLGCLRDAIKTRIIFETKRRLQAKTERLSIE